MGIIFIFILGHRIGGGGEEEEEEEEEEGYGMGTVSYGGFVCGIIDGIGLDWV